MQKIVDLDYEVGNIQAFIHEFKNKKVKKLKRNEIKIRKKTKRKIRKRTKELKN